MTDSGLPNGSDPKSTDPRTVAVEQLGDVLKNIVGNLRDHPVFSFGIGAMLLTILAFGALLFKSDILDRAPAAQWFPVILLAFGVLLAGVEVWAGLRRQRPPPEPSRRFQTCGRIIHQAPGGSVARVGAMSNHESWVTDHAHQANVSLAVDEPSTNENANTPMRPHRIRVFAPIRGWRLWS